MDNNTATYSKGFNNGYLLAKYEPELLALLLKQITRSSKYLEGLFFGKEEYELENHRMQLEELSRRRNDTQDRDHELGLN